MPNTVPAAGEAMPNDDIQPFVSIGEASAAIVDRLKLNRDARDAFDDASVAMARGKSVLKTVWLAMGSSDFDAEDDGSDVRETVYEAIKILTRADESIEFGNQLLMQLREVAR